MSKKFSFVFDVGGKKTLLILFSFFAASASILAQPNTEIYLFDLTIKDGKASVSDPKNISSNVGYDNQPSFHPNGSFIYFSSFQNDQTEIMQYNTMRGSRTVMTTSSGSEYSPTVTPDREYISAIILKSDGEQLLWKYPIEGGQSEVVIPELVVGYHCWYDDKTVFSFVLGNPPTLQVTTVKKNKTQILAQNIGRSLHKVPNKKLISYIQKDSTKAWTINTYNPKSKEFIELIKTLEGSEDYAWTPEGQIIMGQGSSLFICDPWSEKVAWEKFADLSEYNLKGVTRIAISTYGRDIAVVVEE